ncbi:hypothetical protein DSM112329_02943 [Paraconexibacter sp. AEG42_29]|uniref:Uncharacterized protein n=1 Tax=Paraconexibacter sp. AEG42_29 TaxID=2997339 RepID=A0AAU7AWU0_9ACTN
MEPRVRSLRGRSRITGMTPDHVLEDDADFLQPQPQRTAPPADRAPQHESAMPQPASATGLSSRGQLRRDPPGRTPAPDLRQDSRGTGTRRRPASGPLAGLVAVAAAAALAVIIVVVATGGSDRPPTPASSDAGRRAPRATPRVVAAPKPRVTVKRTRARRDRRGPSRSAAYPASVRQAPRREAQRPRSRRPAAAPRARVTRPRARPSSAMRAPRRTSPAAVRPAPPRPAATRPAQVRRRVQTPRRVPVPRRREWGGTMTGREFGAGR